MKLNLYKRFYTKMAQPVPQRIVSYKSFPYKKYFIEGDLNRYDMFDMLKEYSPVIESMKGGTLLKRVEGVSVKSKCFFNTTEEFVEGIIYNRNHVYLEKLIYTGNTYSFDVLSDIYNEQERVKTSKLGRMTIYDLYKQEVNKNPAMFKAMTVEERREYMYNKFSYHEATQFKPSIALTCYMMFADEGREEKLSALPSATGGKLSALPSATGGKLKILDISAGYGDRLLAALALRVTKYLAFDPNKNLKAGHDKMIKDFYGKEDKRFEVRYKPFESFPLVAHGSAESIPQEEDFEHYVGYFDLVFTSPPFFDLERYSLSDEEGQSIVGKRSLDDWIVNFLFESLKIAMECLREGGNMVIHIDDYRGVAICEKMCFFLCSIGMKFEGVIGYTKENTSGKPKLLQMRPMWHFSKPKEVSVETLGYYRQSFHEYYRSLYELTTKFF